MNDSPIFRVAFSVLAILWIGSFLLYRAASATMRRFVQGLRLPRRQDPTLELNLR